MAGRKTIGTKTERAVAAIGWDMGYFVSSLRHSRSPGDQLWTPPSLNGTRPRQLLIEIKGRLNLWEGFRADDRAEMIAASLQFGFEPLVAWSPPGIHGVIWLPIEDWPV